MDTKKLIQMAMEAMEQAYAPYSEFYVGAALLSKNNDIFLGCNIENASYSATNCAERTAFYKAVSQGVREFRAIVIVGGHHKKLTDYCAPCGICRQVMREFCEPHEFELILAKNLEDYKTYTLEELLPLGFGPETIKNGGSIYEDV